MIQKRRPGPLSSETRIEFTGNKVKDGWEVIVEREGAAPARLSVRDGKHSDFVFLEKTPCGLAGLSVRSGRPVTFARQADRAP